MTGTGGLEKLLENAKFAHLSEATLVAYKDNELGDVESDLADAHLKLCLLCGRRLTFLTNEAEALENYVVTEEDRASIRTLVSKGNTGISDSIAIDRDRLNADFQELLRDWTDTFSKPIVRSSHDSQIWSFESEDKLLSARAEFDEQQALTVHILSSEVALEGLRILFRLGPFHEEVTLQLSPNNEVTAKVVMPVRERPQKLNDISIMILQSP